jgi:hypothetical protein
MPETAVHKDTGPVFPQHQIRMSWQTGRIQPIAKPSTPQSSPHNQFRLRVFRPYSRHILMPLLRGEFIHEANGVFAKVQIISECISPSNVFCTDPQERFLAVTSGNAYENRKKNPMKWGIFELST